eukprot:767309-Hanusia_phi.AAC.5
MVASMNTPLRFNCSSMHLAAFRGYNRTLSLLLQSVQDVDARDEQLGTSLHKAALNGHTSAVKALLQAGADVNAADAANCSALHLAVSRGNVHVRGASQEGMGRERRRDRVPGDGDADCCRSRRVCARPERQDGDRVLCSTPFLSHEQLSPSTGQQATGTSLARRRW